MTPLIAACQAVYAADEVGPGAGDAVIDQERTHSEDRSVQVEDAHVVDLELQQGGLVRQARRVQLQSTGVVGVDVTQQTSVHRIAGGQLVQSDGLHQHVELSQLRTEAEATDSS